MTSQSIFTNFNFAIIQTEIKKSQNNNYPYKSILNNGKQKMKDFQKFGSLWKP